MWWEGVLAPPWGGVGHLVGPRLASSHFSHRHFFERGKASMYLVRMTQESSPAFTITTSRPRERLGVIVRAGAEEVGGRDP